MKPRPSKLDQFSGPLLEMNDAGKTLADMQAWLKGEGVSAAISTLGEFLERLRSQRLQDRLLDSITSGANQIKEVEERFGKNPAPEMETLIKLHRVLILQLSTKANTDPRFISACNESLRTVMEFMSGLTKARFKERELNLAEAKYAQLALKMASELKIISSNKNLSEADKVDAARRKLFGVEGN